MEMQLADQLRQLRQDNAALRAALERTQSERDAWRLRCDALAFKQAQFIHRLHGMVKELE
jgi:hypothetical protein